MLRSAGYEVSMLNDQAINTLRGKGYTGGVSRQELNSMGYTEPNMPMVGLEGLTGADLFVDLKTAYLDSFVRLYSDIPVLHFLINGGKDDYDNCGFSYPVATANMWVEGNAFKVWLPFDNVHNLKPREQKSAYTVPIGLLHNAKNWGFGHMLQEIMDRTGVRIYGAGSPGGVLHNSKLAEVFATTVGLLHIKSNDCPGYALYEAMEAGVPLILCEQMLDRMKMRDLYEEGVTCELWGGDFYDKKYCQETGLTKEWFRDNPSGVIDGMMVALEKLKDPAYNEKIGKAGHKRFHELTDWTPKKRKDFVKFLNDNGLQGSIQ